MPRLDDHDKPRMCAGDDGDTVPQAVATKPEDVPLGHDAESARHKTTWGHGPFKAKPSLAQEAAKASVRSLGSAWRKSDAITVEMTAPDRESVAKALAPKGRPRKFSMLRVAADTAKIDALAVAMAVVSTVPSLCILVPPCFMPETKASHVILAAFVYNIPAVLGMTQIGCLLLDYKDCVENRRAVAVIYGIRLAGSLCVALGVRSALLFSSLPPLSKFLVDVALCTLLPTLDFYGSMLVMTPGSWRERLMSCVRQMVIFVYVAGFAGICIVNYLVIPGTVAESYLGFITQGERMILCVLKNLALEYVACGGAGWLVAVTVHFEVDTQLAIAFAIVAAESVQAPLQQIGASWVLFLANMVIFYRIRADETTDEIEAMPLLWRWAYKAMTFVSGCAKLYPHHLLVGNALNNICIAISQTSAYLWVAMSTSLLILAGGEHGLGVEAHFLPHGRHSLWWMALMWASTIVQDVVTLAVIQVKGIKTRLLVDEYAGTGARLLLHAVFLSSNSWIFLLVATFGWYRSLSR
uniref:Uncharacterized protein n=1 Tax=Alexandrium monilatum TaxID=311494 RepID=A0A7S4Q233_9DINO|mmetsp:Transcript_19658/g.59292  ORF Transcript_19658/g.59292 Transcript_19658/m.59292 type:complete len:524 (-) Transcript_19658:82-1653(-)